MYRFVLVAFLFIQGCAHINMLSDTNELASANDENSALIKPTLETTHVATFDHFFDEALVHPLVFPRAPNGWLVESEHQPLPLEVVEFIDRPSDLLERIRNGFTFDLEEDNARIRAQVNWYVKHPEYLNRVFTRSSRYLYHIVERLEQENLPIELALLPVVESAFNPFAYSHGRASGLWQFIPGTGKMYGLHQSWWFDGRRDVLLSTEAAIDYLSWLSGRFNGNWMHALASYNTGPGRVRKSIKRNKKLGKPTDFWSLKLPRETRAYVPKLIAMAKIVADPQRYNLTLTGIPNQPYFSVVDLDSQIDLAQAAELIKLDIEEIYQLNPGLNQWATPPSGPFRLLMPEPVAQKFEDAVKKLSPSQRLTWDSYIVKRGDVLSKVATRFHTTPKLIRQVNTLKNNTIYKGQELLIPVASKSKNFYNLSEQNRLTKIQTKVQGKKGASRLFYTVKTGDTFWDISRAHKVSVKQIAKWNGMAPGDMLRPGKKLLIWSNTAGKRSSHTSTATPQRPSLSQSYAPRDALKRLSYRVRNGDSLWLIAKRFKVSVNDLRSWNNLRQGKYLQPGQKIMVYVDITRG